MPDSSFDLAAYLRRIGHDGPVSADIATLRRLHALHAATIPFENLSPLLGEDIALDAASLHRKLIDDGRGGWCYEHNLLFRHALEAIGFAVRGLAARVRWNAPEGAVRARTHMLLLVAIDGDEWLADVGFGGLSLSAPLRFAPGHEQATPHEPFRITPEGASWLLQFRLGDAWHALYAFDLQEQHLADYELASWYLAHHPQSLFVNHLLAARAAHKERHALFDTRYTRRFAGGSESRDLANVEELKDVLRERFLLRLPQHPELDARLARLFTDGAMR
jgi:N-hydroxyarylamine O-acetyltransferase